MTNFLRYSFQAHDPPCSRNGLPLSASCNRKGESSRDILPAVIRLCCALGLKGGVFFFHPHTSFPAASRSSSTLSFSR